ncbi:MAG: hypothetical protein ACJ73S_07835 [Mycobacteriales bacterium]
MTEPTGDGGPERPVTVGVDPEVPRPAHVGFRVNVPDAWFALDLDPATSNASIEAYLDRCLSARPARAGAHRGQMRAILRQAVAAQRAEGIFFSAFLAGNRGRPEDVVGASLTIAFRQLPDGGLFEVDPMVATLATADLEPGENAEARIVGKVLLQAGWAAYSHTNHLTPVPRSHRRQRVAFSQYFIPTPDLTWAAVLTVTTPNLDLALGVDGIAEGVAQSIEWLDATGRPIPGPEPPAEFSDTP